MTGPSGMRASNISYILPSGRLLLKSISFAALPNECMGIIGANGVGKSTLLRIMARRIKSTSGSVNVFGDISYMEQRRTDPEIRTIGDYLFSAAPTNISRCHKQIKLMESELDSMDTAQMQAYSQLLADYADLGGYRMEADMSKSTQDVLGSSYQDVSDLELDCQKVIHRWSDAIHEGELRPLHALDEYVIASKRIYCIKGYLKSIRQSGISILGQTLTALINTGQYQNMPLAMLVECSNRRFPINRRLVCTAIQHGLFTCGDAQKLMDDNRDMAALLPALRYAWYNPTPILGMLPDCLLQPEFTLPWNVNVAYPNCPCPYIKRGERQDDDMANIRLQTHRRLKGSVAHYVSVTVWTDAIDVYWSRSVLGDTDDMYSFIGSLLEASIQRYSGDF